MHAPTTSADPLPRSLSRRLTRWPVSWLGLVLVLTMILLAASMVGEHGKPTAAGTVRAVAPGQSPGPLYVPTALRAAAWPSPPPVVASGLPVAMAAEGALLYLVYHARIEIIDWKDIHDPRRLSSLPMGDAVEICHVSVRGSLLAIVTGPGCAWPYPTEVSLHLAVAATPTAPRWAGQVDLHGKSNGLAVGDGFTYVALGGAGIAVVDVRDPDRPRLGDSVAISAGRLAMGSGHLFGAPGSNRLDVIDVTDPAHPVPVNGIAPPTYGFASALVPVGRHVAVGGSFSRVASVGIWDVADPVRPRLVVTVGQHMDMINNNDVAWEGNRLFVGHAEAVAAFDTVDVEHPRDLGRLPVPEEVLALASVAEYGLVLTRVGTVVAIEAAAGGALRRVAEYRAPE